MSAINTLKRNWKAAVSAAAISFGAAAGTGCAAPGTMEGVTTNPWFKGGVAAGAGAVAREVAREAGVGRRGANWVGGAAAAATYGVLDHHGSQIPECDHRERTSRDVRVNNQTGQVTRDETRGRTTSDCRQSSYGSGAGAQGYDPNPTGYGQPR